MRHAWIVLAALVAIVAATTPGVRVRRVCICEPAIDDEHACIVRPRLVDALAQRPDGAEVPTKIREQVVVWQIERAGAYELDLHPASEGASAPAIHVEDSLGQTVSDSSSELRARTRTLAPGAYRIYVTGAIDTPRELVLGIAPLPPATAAK
jgi:hypothetical protein